MAPGVFQSLREGYHLGVATVEGFDFMAEVRPDDEIQLLGHEVDRYRALRIGAAWEEVRDEFIRQAIDQLRAQRLAITGESVGTWLAGQSHFFLPEEIDAVIVAPLWGRQ